MNAADARTDDPGEVAHHAQDAKTLLAFFLGQDIGDHGIVGWSGKSPDQTNDYGEGVHKTNISDQTKQQCGQGAENQAEEDETPASKAVSQRATQHPAERVRTARTSPG